LQKHIDLLEKIFEKSPGENATFSNLPVLREMTAKQERCKNCKNL
jgi:hypothetical protein